MKKFIFIFCFIILIENAGAYCYNNSYVIQSQLDSKRYQLSSAMIQQSRNSARSSSLTDSINDLKSQISSLESQLSSNQSDYQTCTQNATTNQEATSIFEKGYNSYEQGRFDEAIGYFEQYLTVNTDKHDIDYQSAQTNLKLAYFKLGQAYIDKRDYENALIYFKNILTLDDRNVLAIMKVGLIYTMKGDTENALSYLNLAYKYATDKNDIDGILVLMKIVNKSKEITDAKRSITTSDLIVKNTEDLNKKATKQFENYKKAYSRFTNDQKKIRYNTLLSRLQKQIKALNGDRLIINNNIINLITIELNNL